MIGVFKDLMLSRFWTDWDQKFKRGYEMYVNPDHPLVGSEADKLGIDSSQSASSIAVDLWDYILSSYEYDLEKRWRKPHQTISSGKGDCEDYCFLIASLLPHYGVNEFEIIAGNAEFQNKSELHVWMRVDGKIIDPTAEKWKVEEVSYVPELEYEVTVGEQ